MFIDTIIQREAALIVSGFKVLSCAQKAIQPTAIAFDTSSFTDYANGEMETRANPVAWIISTVFACFLAIACVLVCGLATAANFLLKATLKHPLPDESSGADVTQATIIIVAIVTTLVVLMPK